MQNDIATLHVQKPLFEQAWFVARACVGRSRIQGPGEGAGEGEAGGRGEEGEERKWGDERRFGFPWPEWPPGTPTPRDGRVFEDESGQTGPDPKSASRDAGNC